MTQEEFFANLAPDESWVNIFMYEDQLEYIPEAVKMQMCLNEVRQNNPAFEDDDTHKELRKDYSKAKRALRDYEYFINNK